MAGLNEARERMYKAFSDGWGTTTPFVFDNESFKPPAKADFVRVAARHRDSAQETLGDVGNRKFERSGALFLQFFSPLNKGLGSATAGPDFLVNKGRALFEGVTLAPENIRFTNVIVREIGPTEDGYYQTNAECLFGYTERK